MDLVQNIGQWYGVTKVHRYPAERVGQFPGRLGQAEDALLLFLLAAQLTQVGAALHHFLITDVDRHKYDGFAVIPQEAAHGHRQHARAWWQHAPGAGADRKSTRLNSSHVRISYAVFCLKNKNKHG